MRLNKLKLSDKETFDKYLNLKKHELSVYSFPNIYIWRKFFDIRWVVIADNLCIFFEDEIGCFLYLPPLGRFRNPQVARDVFKILDGLNKNTEFSHLENIEEKDLQFYKDAGFECSFKAYDYLCRRADLAGLKGNKFKSKRASCNYFTKHYDFNFELLSAKDRTGCLKLYNLWTKQRRSYSQDKIYQGLLSDSSVSLKEAFANYSALGFKGGRVKVNKELKGFTFGFALNPETFCILFEITDLTIKGLAQFIFCAFTRELKNYKFINIMDDSGLENLKKVKLSYHPARLIPAYVVRRKQMVNGDSDFFNSKGQQLFSVK